MAMVGRAQLEPMLSRRGHGENGILNDIVGGLGAESGLAGGTVDQLSV